MRKSLFIKDDISEADLVQLMFDVRLRQRNIQRYGKRVEIDKTSFEECKGKRSPRRKPTFASWSRLSDRHSFERRLVEGKPRRSKTSSKSKGFTKYFKDAAIQKTAEVESLVAKQQQHKTEYVNRLVDVETEKVYDEKEHVDKRCKDLKKRITMLEGMSGDMATKALTRARLNLAKYS